MNGLVVSQVWGTAESPFSRWFLSLALSAHLLPQRNISRKCPKKWGELHINTLFYDFTEIPILPTTAEWTSNQHEGILRKFLSWSKKLFESFFSVLLRKSPVCSEVGSAQSVLMSQLISGSVSKSYQFFAFLIGNVTASLFVYTLYPHRPGY